MVLAVNADKKYIYFVQSSAIIPSIIAFYLTGSIYKYFNSDKDSDIKIKYVFL